MRGPIGMGGRIWLGGALCCAALGAGAAASAAGPGVSPACREWRSEHHHWSARALGRILVAAPQASVDAALLEVLQRETYLTSCPVSVAGARFELIGWRLVGRTPDAFAGALIESVLERAGIELDLRRRLRVSSEVDETYNKN